MEIENINTTEEISQEYKHQNRERLCYYTNELHPQEEIIKYTMKDRGFGSIFDACTFTIQLHKITAEFLNRENILKPEWFNNEQMATHKYKNDEDYSHEDDINKFVNSLILENREYIQNCENCFCWKLDRKDWINIEKKSL